MRVHIVIGCLIQDGKWLAVARGEVAEDWC